MPPLWQVLTQRQFSDVLADGRVADVMEISFQTESGVTGSVRVPLDQYEPEVVRGLLDRRAALIEQVQALAGEG